MSQDWQYQIRIHLPDDLARLARTDRAAPALRALSEVLDAHGAADGRGWAGTWAVERLGGTRVLHVRRTGGGPGVVRVSVEGDELIHDTEPGRAAALRRR